MSDVSHGSRRWIALLRTSTRETEVSTPQPVTLRTECAVENEMDVGEHNSAAKDARASKGQGGIS